MWFLLWLLQLLLVTGVNRSLGISDEWFAMGDSLVLTVLGQVCRRPLSFSANYSYDGCLSKVESVGV